MLTREEIELGKMGLLARHPHLQKVETELVNMELPKVTDAGNAADSQRLDRFCEVGDVLEIYGRKYVVTSVSADKLEMRDA